MTKQFLFELSKEHSLLSAAEISACLQAEHIPFSVVEKNSDVLVIQTPASPQQIRSLSTRLSYTFYIDELICSSAPLLPDFHHMVTTHPITKKGSIVIRRKNRSACLDSKSFLDIVESKYTPGRTVSLQHPDVEVRVFLTDTKIFVGVKLAEISRKDFEQRKPHLRPFFSPISLHPKLARAVVNLSCIQKNETLLDPFCGTGGILLEAGLMGINIIGNDFQKNMVEGCKKTLEHFDIKKYSLFCFDIGDMKKHISSPVDSIVTDLPYGRATTTKGEGINPLYKRAFEQMQHVLKKGKRAVMGVPNKQTIELGENFFSVQEVHTIRVHKSLTRYFVVYQN